MDCLTFRQRPDRSQTLVTIHGFLGDSSSLDAVVRRVEPLFARVEPLTIPGHAGTRHEARWTFDTVVDQLSARCAMGGEALVLGYSMGARLALAMVLRAPERFAGAVLVGVDPGFEPERAHERSARVQWERTMRASLERDGIERFVDLWETLPIFASQRSLPESTRAAVRARRCGHDPMAVGWAIEALGTGAMPPLWDGLGALAVPTIIVTGELDSKFTLVAERMSQRSPRIERRVVPGVGHDVTLEAPDAVASAIRALVDRERAKGEIT
jgi:2-succinyl-6-hydroxy-2,4-cyclohexadiene-1-carboxylate synthase